MSKFTGTYPADWKATAKEVKDRANWHCARCGHEHDPATGHTLTVHHLDNDKSNVRWHNLAPLCQKCHLVIQGKVNMHRPWLYEHSEWFRPYVGGFLAKTFLGLDLTREEVMQNLDFYANLQQMALQENEP